MEARRPIAPSAALLRGYDRTLVWSLQHAPLVICLLLGVMALNVRLYIAAPKSFLPNQDTGQLGGFIRGDDGTSFQVMQPKIEVFRQAVLADPAVESVAGFIGGGRGVNNAQTFVRLKPLRERKVSAQVVAERIRRNLPHVAGARLFLNAEQDIRFGGCGGGGGGGGNAQYSYTLLADDLSQLRVWGARVRAALADLPELTGIEDELISSQQVTLNVDRTTARQLGVGMTDVTSALNNAFGQRQVSTIYNALNQYRVVMEVAPELRPGARGARSAARRRRRPAGAAVGVQLATSTRCARDRVNHFQQFASTSISFELTPGVSMSQAHGGHRSARWRASPCRPRSRAACRATPAVPADAGQPAAGHPRHAADRLHRARRALRELRPPADDSLDAAVGRRRRAAGAAAAEHRVQPGRDARGCSCWSAW